MSDVIIVIEIINSYSSYRFVSRETFL